MAGLLPLWLLKTIYPLKELSYARDRPLEVLALGLGRTGTESLAQALDELGYGEVYHGYKVSGKDLDSVPQWVRFGLAKYSHSHHDPTVFSREAFDKVLGHCGAVTDLPTAGFAVEMLRAYPDAKVILNRRKDVDAWYASQLQTIATLWTDWRTLLRSFFESELFWLGQVVLWVPKKMDKGDFAKNGKQMYVEHYASLEEECRKQGREWLNWTVQDGWEPLCTFLEKPVPSRPFPEGNSAASFTARLAERRVEQFRRADRNLAMVGVVMATVLVVIFGWTMGVLRTG